MNDENLKPQNILAHYFSLPFARKHGVVEAIVVKFIAHKVRRATARKSTKTFKDGKHWYFDPISKVAERFPYIPRSTMAGILDRLDEEGLIEIGNYNRFTYDRTGWYTVPQQVMDDAEKTPLIRVDLDIAQNKGIPAAVLMANIRYRLLEEPKKKGKKPDSWPFVSISPAALAGLLPYSAKTIKRTLVELDKAKLIVVNPKKKLSYTLPELLNPKGTNPDEEGSKPDDTGTNPDAKGTEPDAKWTKPDNNTHCKPLETIGIPIKKEPLKESPSGVVLTNSPSDKLQGVENPASQHSALSSTGIKGCAGHVKDERGKPRILKFADLVQFNAQYQGCLNTPGTMEEFVKLVRRLSYVFVDSLSTDDLFRFYAITDQEKLLDQMQEPFTAFFNAKYDRLRDKGNPAFEEVRWSCFCAALEFIILAFERLHDKETRQTHSLEPLQTRVYDLTVELTGRIHREAGERWRQWYERQQKDHADTHQAKENDSTLAPAEKARILRNALKARNAWGYFDRYGEHVSKSHLIFNQGDLDTAEKLFELNRDVCAATLIELIDRCAEIHNCEPKPEGFDKYFHVRQGYRLGWFLKYLPKIAEELGSFALNGWVPLPEPVKDKEDGGQQAEGLEPVEPQGDTVTATGE